MKKLLSISILTVMIIGSVGLANAALTKDVTSLDNPPKPYTGYVTQVPDQSFQAFMAQTEWAAILILTAQKMNLKPTAVTQSIQVTPETSRIWFASPLDQPRFEALIKNTVGVFQVAHKHVASLVKQSDGAFRLAVEDEDFVWDIRNNAKGVDITLLPSGASLNG